MGDQEEWVSLVMEREEEGDSLDQLDLRDRVEEGEDSDLMEDLE